MKSLSNKRLIIEVGVGSNRANFLLDTGASVGIVNKYDAKKLKIKEGRQYKGSIVGAGGTMRNIHYCDTLIQLPNNKQIGQFLIADIANVCDSIYYETKVKIVGIISLPQMKMAGINIDTNSNEIIFE